MCLLPESMKGWAQLSNLQRTGFHLQQQTLAWTAESPALLALPCRMTCPPPVRGFLVLKSTIAGAGEVLIIEITAQEVLGLEHQAGKMRMGTKQGAEALGWEQVAAWAWGLPLQAWALAAQRSRCRPSWALLLLEEHLSRYIFVCGSSAGHCCLLLHQAACPGGCPSSRNSLG